MVLSFQLTLLRTSFEDKFRVIIIVCWTRGRVLKVQLSEFYRYYRNRSRYHDELLTRFFRCKLAKPFSFWKQHQIFRNLRKQILVLKCLIVSSTETFVWYFSRFYGSRNETIDAVFKFSNPKNHKVLLQMSFLFRDFRGFFRWHKNVM